MEGFKEEKGTLSHVLTLNASLFYNEGYCTLGYCIATVLEYLQVVAWNCEREVPTAAVVVVMHRLASCSRRLALRYSVVHYPSKGRLYDCQLSKHLRTEAIPFDLLFEGHQEYSSVLKTCINAHLAVLAMCPCEQRTPHTEKKSTSWQAFLPLVYALRYSAF